MCQRLDCDVRHSLSPRTWEQMAEDTNSTLDYQLDEKALTTIHKNSIMRLYGDSAGDVMNHLRSNPAGTIPIVLKRLQQKEAEWSRAKLDLNKKWKEDSERLYYRSRDHRSFYYQKAEKRKLLSNKWLCNELIDGGVRSSKDTGSKGEQHKTLITAPNPMYAAHARTSQHAAGDGDWVVLVARRTGEAKKESKGPAPNLVVSRDTVLGFEEQADAMEFRDAPEWSPRMFLEYGDPDVMVDTYNVRSPCLQCFARLLLPSSLPCFSCALSHCIGGFSCVLVN